MSGPVNELLSRLLPKRIKLALRIPGQIRESFRHAQKIGGPAARQLLAANVDLSMTNGRRAKRSRVIQVRSHGYSCPVSLRTHTSDPLTFEQVFVREEYRFLAQNCDPKTIIDCGANIGCTSIYLLSRFPSARLIAVEPDPGNASICARNLRPFGPRTEVLQAAVWDRETSLRVERGNFRDGREWSFQVRECQTGELADAHAVTIPWLMEHMATEQIDILKIDIEGAEQQLFSDESDRWLTRVACLAVETHDDNCRQAVLTAILKHRFEVHDSGETLFCVRRTA